MNAGPALVPAIVVGAVRYGDTSKVVRLLTPTFGLVSALAKGASRPGSPFARSLGLLSEGTAHILHRRGDLQLVTAFELTDSHATIAGSTASYLAANALAELVGRAVPSGENPALYHEVRSNVRLLAATPPDAAGVISLCVLWRVIGALGFAPALERCVRDGRGLPPGPLVLSLRDGGALCGSCADPVAGPRLPEEDRAALEAFVLGTGELPDLDDRHLAAHRRLLARWVATHLVEGDLPALAIWQRGR